MLCLSEFNRSWLKILKERNNNNNKMMKDTINTLDSSEDDLNSIEIEKESSNKSIQMDDKQLGPHTIDIPGVDFYKIPHKVA